MSVVYDIYDCIVREEKRLSELYADIPHKRKDFVSGLIRRAAFARASLEALEKDITKNGFTEEFSQGNQDPYQRERPVVRIYNSLTSSYQKLTKQLADLLPKENPKAKESDEFEEF